MERYICIHAHFYQPPRENAWLEAIELQDAAYPYHDWNERIMAECYWPNAASRILDKDGRIVRIVNNYASISFNFGPTLLSWMEQNAPEVYETVLETDGETRNIFSGHGSALAQAYNHMIMPLANSRDKYTQVYWAIRDFQHRFGRQPEGMWLPETAVDLETLDLLAEQGIRFTILAPHQAARVRKLGARQWQDVAGGRINPTMAYQLSLPSARKINLFFYDEAIARAVAFGGLLSSGEGFAQRLASSFSEAPSWPQLVHIASDGETYGHHHRHGDMALAYALHYIQSKNLARLTNYGEYLEKHPPTHEVEIFENTSWSCAHGVERWRSDCGCTTLSRPGWNQAWRAPLREAFDWLRDTLAPRYEVKARQLLKDPWVARNDYIQVVLDRSSDTLERFLARHAVHQLAEDEKVTVLKLLELQRHVMLMYTSCAWFFSDLSGIETVQVMQYAGRAIQLAAEVFGDDLEGRFLRLLERAKSNVPEYGDGRRIFEKFVKPAMVDLARVAAHYAVSSLFKDYPEHTTIYCFAVEREDHHTSQAGRVKLAVGWARFTSEITRESAMLCFGALHFGDHNLNCGVHEFQQQEAYQTLVQEATKSFIRADLAETIRLLDRHFGMSTYSLRSLFSDERRKILNLILETALGTAEMAYRQLYEQNALLMRFLTDLGIPLPKPFRATAEFAINSYVQQAFESEELDLEHIENLLEEAKLENVALDRPTLEYKLRHTMERIAEQFLASPADLAILQRLDAAAGLAHSLPFEVDLWKVQNICYGVLHTVYPEFRSKAERGGESDREWVIRFNSLSDKLWVRAE